MVLFSNKFGFGHQSTNLFPFRFSLDLGLVYIFIGASEFLWLYVIYLFICMLVCLFVCLFMYYFNLYCNKISVSLVSAHR